MKVRVHNPGPDPNPCPTCGFGVPPTPSIGATSRERVAWGMRQVGTPIANPKTTKRAPERGQYALMEGVMNPFAMTAKGGPKEPSPMCGPFEKAVQVDQGVFKCVPFYSGQCPPRYMYNDHYLGQPVCIPPDPTKERSAVTKRRAGLMSAGKGTPSAPPSPCPPGKQQVQVGQGEFKCVPPYGGLCPPGYMYNDHFQGKPVCIPPPPGTQRKKTGGLFARLRRFVLRNPVASAAFGQGLRPKVSSSPQSVSQERMAPRRAPATPGTTRGVCMLQQIQGGCYTRIGDDFKATCVCPGGGPSGTVAPASPCGPGSYACGTNPDGTVMCCDSRTGKPIGSLRNPPVLAVGPISARRMTPRGACPPGQEVCGSSMPGDPPICCPTEGGGSGGGGGFPSDNSRLFLGPPRRNPPVLAVGPVSAAQRSVSQRRSATVAAPAQPQTPRGGYCFYNQKTDEICCIGESGMWNCRPTGGGFPSDNSRFFLGPPRRNPTPYEECVINNQCEVGKPWYEEQKCKEQCAQISGSLSARPGAPLGTRRAPATLATPPPRPVAPLPRARQLANPNKHGTACGEGSYPGPIRVGTWHCEQIGGHHEVNCECRDMHLVYSPFHIDPLGGRQLPGMLAAAPSRPRAVRPRAPRFLNPASFLGGPR